MGFRDFLRWHCPLIFKWAGIAADGLAFPKRSNAARVTISFGPLSRAGEFIRDAIIEVLKSALNAPKMLSYWLGGFAISLFLHKRWDGTL
ncbi:hypothetical protein CDAR_25731 [Caerostris darwini]|uniref:Uncharacterized protein n=1 Tax=Caerostris darwini TaxID=1538125 RepID=A0AAV4RRH2_9ARAC|nr:hypothetical protein CDAR_25731 [Caerostris darwini]